MTEEIDTPRLSLGILTPLETSSMFRYRSISQVLPVAIEIATVCQSTKLYRVVYTFLVSASSHGGILRGVWVAILDDRCQHANVLLAYSRHILMDARSS